MKHKIYVAGPLNASAPEYIQNLHKMIHYAEIIRRKGFSVYVPGLDFLMGLIHGHYSYTDYFDNSQPWLAVSDALFLCPGWEKSNGAQQESRFATHLNIPVFTDINSLLTYFELK